MFSDPLLVHMNLFSFLVLSLQIVCFQSPPYPGWYPLNILLFVNLSLKLALEIESDLPGVGSSEHKDRYIIIFFFVILLNWTNGSFFFFFRPHNTVDLLSSLLVENTHILTYLCYSTLPPSCICRSLWAVVNTLAALGWKWRVTVGFK